MKTFPQTTEFVALGGSASTPGFNLMWITAEANSCGVDMGDQYVVIGGKGATRKVTSYKDIIGFYRARPDLLFGRYGHSCAKFH